MRQRGAQSMLARKQLCTDNIYDTQEGPCHRARALQFLALLNPCCSPAHVHVRVPPAAYFHCSPRGNSNHTLPYIEPRPRHCIVRIIVCTALSDLWGLALHYSRGCVGTTLSKRRSPPSPSLPSAPWMGNRADLLGQTP